MSTLIFWVVLIFMIIGAVGTILPVIPGTPLIFLAALGYGFYEHFQKLDVTILGVLFFLMAVSLLIDYFAGVVGAKKYGATKYGAWGSFLGGIVGVIFFSIPGLLVGPFAGAVIGEIVGGKNTGHAVKVGLGTVLGLAGGAFFKFVLAVAMIVIYVSALV